MDMHMISEFIFGSKFEDFLRILYENLVNQDVILSKSDYAQHVNNSIFELSLDVLQYMKDVDLDKALEAELSELNNEEEQ